MVANETWDIVSPYATHPNGTNVSYEFGTPTVGLAGMFYRLCWAHDPSDLGDFKVEVDGDADLVDLHEVLRQAGREGERESCMNL